MGYGTKIEWAHHTYNAWYGCTRISPACDHCYAADWDRRHHGGQHWGAGVARQRTTQRTRNAPYRWGRKAREEGFRPRVFCSSLADVFDSEVPEEWRRELWQVIRDTPELDWLLLTKRIGNVERMLPEDWGDGWEHVWLGITVVTEVEVDRDVPKLLDVPAAVRWLSMEPLLGAVDLTAIDLGSPRLRAQGCDILCHLNALTGIVAGPDDVFPSIDWVVVGGESGPHARPMHPLWVESIRDQCAAAAVPFFFKQWGEWAPRSDVLEDGTVLTKLDPQCKRWPQVIRLTESAGNGNRCEDCDGGEDRFMQKVGKTLAGRLLGGAEYHQFPR